MNFITKMLAVAVTGLLLSVSSAFAQFGIVNTQHPCLPIIAFETHMLRIGQARVSVGLGSDRKTKSAIYKTANGSNWTIVLYPDGNMACVILVGKNYMPVIWFLDNGDPA